MFRFRNRYLIPIDAALLGGTILGLYVLRFESWSLAPVHAATAWAFALSAVPIHIAVLLAFGLYRRLWRFTSIRDMEHILLAGAVAAIPDYLIGRIGLQLFDLAPARVPLSVLLPYLVMSTGLVALPRLAIRLMGGLERRSAPRRDTKRALIAGAGVAGEMIVRELARNGDLGLTPVAFVDDDCTKHRLRLAGLPICGGMADIPRLAKELSIDEIVIAMPRASGSTVRSVLRLAEQAGIKTRIVPGLFEIISGKVSVANIREVRIDDLLRRDVIQTDLAPVLALAADRTVLVTGAGGSIGSELCRQLLALGPARLILLGHAENPIFDVMNELAGSASGTEILPVIADVRMGDRIRQVLMDQRPHVIFHAAAHKHVPLMENNPAEAITNNVLGTRNLVQAAIDCGAERFVMISTDKAVRPTNVMGATKRIAEYVVQNAGRRSGTKFVSVRFGNVLGSQGSVVPTFTRQIREGGPVTVTHPEMRRYFMTIPEAVQLVLQAGTLGNGNELFMLDMGEPVRIVDLARDMIRLSGMVEGEDIRIEFTGVRPGEKLYEEMFFGYEVAEPTEHPKILRARAGSVSHATEEEIADLIDAASDIDLSAAELRKRLRHLVPDYHPSVPPRQSESLEDPESMHEPAMAPAS